MTDKTKLLWHSNAPWSPTGYGQQTGLFAPYLAQEYDLGISSFYGLEGASITYNGIPIYPGMGQDFGNEYLRLNAMNHFGDEVTAGGPKDGMVVTLMDVWVLNPLLPTEMNMVCWVPVDHDPITSPVKSFFGTGAIPLAMSRFGQEQLADIDALYCPHAVDTEVYKPFDRAKVRELAGIDEDAFVVGMVAANKGRPSRKGFVQAFEAFKAFHDRHPEAVLYLHTCLEPKWAGGEDLEALLSALRIPPSAVRRAPLYKMLFDPFPPRQMAMLYSGMDVLLNPAMGEGFGIPIIEAQACGVPVIATDFSAMKELTGSGWLVSHRKYWSGHNSWQAIPDWEDILSALNEAYNYGPEGRKHLGEKAREFALQYDVRTVFQEHMLPALREAEQRFEDRKPVELKAVA